jgi:hypothetical protein
MKLRSTALLLLSAACAAGQQWSDRAEYDLALDIRRETSAEARLALLDAWKQKYPDSRLRHQRAELTLAAAQSSGDTRKMYGAAVEMLAASPDSFPGLYWTTALLPSQPVQSPAALQAGDGAAKRLLAAAPSFFNSDAFKRSGASAESASAEQKRVESFAHRALGWTAWKRGDLDTARRELLLSLEAVPQRAETSAWLGAISVTGATAEQRIESIWHLARAAYLDGEGALPSVQRREVRALLDAAYTSYHGSDEGLDLIGTSARANVLPPAGFKIETAAEAAERVWNQQVLQANPELEPYLAIRKLLIAANDADMASVLAGITLPRFKGRVIGCATPTKVSEIHIGITNAETQEAVLKFDSPVPACPAAGSTVEFSGKLSAFSKDPYLLTIAAERKGLTISAPLVPQED